MESCNSLFCQCDEQAGEKPDVSNTFERTGRTEIGHRSFSEVMVLVFGIGHICATFQVAGKCLWLTHKLMMFVNGGARS